MEKVVEYALGKWKYYLVYTPPFFKNVLVLKFSWHENKTIQIQSNDEIITKTFSNVFYLCDEIVVKLPKRFQM